MQENVIAKKYAKALASVCNADELVNIYDVYNEISKAFSIKKMYYIVNSHVITKDEKISFIKSLINKNINEYADRLLSILIKNDRSCLLPFVTLELKKIIDSKSNTYIATLYVKTKLDNDSIYRIQNNLGKKLGVTLSIMQEIDSNIDGIKLEVIELGIEVSFLKNRFTQELKDFILKAV